MVASDLGVCQDADLREDSEMGVELDEDLFEEFIEGDALSLAVC